MYIYWMNMKILFIDLGGVIPLVIQVLNQLWGTFEI